MTEVLVRNREAGFVQVHLAPIRRIMRVTERVQRARALGAYVLVSQLVDEHAMLSNAAGPLLLHRDDVARFLGIRPHALSTYVRLLESCGTLEVVARVGSTGWGPSEWHLPRRQKAHVRITNASITAIVGEVGPTRLLSHLGLYLTLHYLANEARHGARQTLASYREIASLCGLSEKPLKAHKAVLERAGIVRVSASVQANGGTGPQRWDLVDAPTGRIDHDRDALTEGRRKVPGGSAENCPLGVSVSAPGADQVAGDAETTPGGSSTSTAPYARTSRDDIEDVSFESQGADQQPFTRIEWQLCQRMHDLAAARTTPAIANEPDSWQNDRERWLAACRDVLTIYPEANDLRHAIDYLDHDRRFLGSLIFTMPALAQRIHTVMTRAREWAGSQARAVAPDAGETPNAPSWSEVSVALQDAARRFGATRRAAALAHLTAIHPAIGELALSSGWSGLCRSNPTYWPRDLKPAWESLVSQRDDAARTP